MTQNTSISVDTLINIIPNFDDRKTIEIQDLIDQVEEITKELKLPDPLKVILLKNKCHGKARELINNSPDISEEKNYDELKKKLIQAFQITGSFENTQHKFMGLTQMPTQSIDDYIKHFDIIAAKYLKQSGQKDKDGAAELLNSIKLPRFLDSIRADIAFEVRKSAPKTYEAATKLAKNIERAFNSKKPEIDNSEQVNSLCDSLVKLSNTQKETIENLTQEINALKIAQQPTQTSQDIGATSRWCYICNIASHDTHLCWYNSKNKEITNWKAQNFQNSHQTAYSRQNYNAPPSPNYFPRETYVPKNRYAQNDRRYDNRYEENSYNHRDFRPPNDRRNYQGDYYERKPNKYKYEKRDQQRDPKYDSHRGFRHDNQTRQQNRNFREEKMNKRFSGNGSGNFQ